MNKLGSILVLILLGSCATTPPKPNVATSMPSKGPSIEFDYVRGESLHRFVAVAGKTEARVEFFKDAKMTHERKINRLRYDMLSKQAVNVLDAFQPEEVSNCRTPFVLKVKDLKSTRVLEGCRNSEKAAMLGKFIRDAEYLAFAK